jgi:hypothetical protein
MADHVSTRCTQCGQADDHPKWHTPAPEPGTTGTQSFHHDCAPAWLLNQHPAGHLVHEIVAAARDGKHGDDLRRHIANLHQNQED